MGETNFETVRSLKQLAQISHETNDTNKMLYIKARVEELEGSPREACVDTMFWLNLFAEIYRELHEQEKEVRIRRQMYQMSRKVLGLEHIDSIRTLRILAETYYFYKDYKKAFEFMKDTYTLFCRVLGEENVETIGVREKLIAIKRFLNK